MPTLILRLDHALVPGRDATVVNAVAEIMTRPCFASLQRVALETAAGRRLRYTKKSTEAIKTYLTDPRCKVVNLDSGRAGDLVAEACLYTGFVFAQDSWVAYPAPLEPYVIVPHETDDDPVDRIDALCLLAQALHAISGCVSMESGFGIAQRLGIGGSTHPEKLLAMQPGLTPRRLAERRRYDKRKLDREVPSPEWGLYLSRGHLDVVPADELEASEVFHRVRRLGDDLVFLQLTADPADALRPDYDDLLDPVRRVLAPVLSPGPD